MGACGNALDVDHSFLLVLGAEASPGEPLVVESWTLVATGVLTTAADNIHHAVEFMLAAKSSSLPLV